MECGGLQYSLSMTTKPVMITTEPDSPGRGKLLVLSVDGGETGKTADGGRYAKLRKSTSQSKLMVVAFSLGERCRRVLTKRKSSPQLEIDDPVPVQVEMVDQAARLADPVVSQLSRSPSPYLSPRPSSISSARVSYESSFITLSYTESVRSSLSSDLSFWCRGLDPAWDCDFATDNDRQEKLVSTGS
ncbi:hypothetical protein PGT21_022673 [Puccinia graminis f. sp. tritici]|uniref:Uncharacterized protein n=1 Tax=Puccinia graminis f. sp. tritici TaxID=56615 RepID=A0A5B0RE35_PUCGR|nr:hypothetical protein PGT21_022673 [Puccinia graminis f. sp. tritici]KAA1124066.1 hypothetical protein PGTUg99_024602 [Puccinia graminis f. sp. tritici]